MGQRAHGSRAILTILLPIGAFLSTRSPKRSWTLPLRWVRRVTKPFKNQAQTHIAAALETLREIGADVTLENAYHLLLDQSDLDEAMTDLASGHQTMRRRELAEHFTNRFLSQPPEQIGGVKETIANYLQPFITPEIAQVFCAAGNSFEFADLDRGKIICVAMPQKFQMERRYINTFLKMLFYTHALRRFDKAADERQRDNLLILWADEAQRFVTASEDGMSDYNCIDVIREARATVVAAAQSSTSFIPPLGREKARVFTLNLRNRLIFKAADEEGALDSADFLGKKRVIKKSWGYHSGRMSRNYSEQEEHKIKPHILRNYPKHTAVVVHCEGGYRRRLLPPCESDGKLPRWFAY
jgi:type IV secretory pathway TraG/TraD family ATPase VirD4